MIPDLELLNSLSLCKPRASGDDPADLRLRQIRGRVNPARAGMIRASQRGPSGRARKPRASGDDPVADDGGDGGRA